MNGINKKLSEIFSPAWNGTLATVVTLLAWAYICGTSSPIVGRYATGVAFFVVVVIWWLVHLAYQNKENANASNN